MEIVPLSLSSPGEHLAAWHTLNAAYWAEEVPEVDPPGELESRWELDSDRTGQRGGFLAFEADAVVGAACYEFALLEDLDEAYIWLYVPKPLRRRGIGRALLTAAGDLARSAGRHTLRGDARVDADGAQFATAAGARSTQIDLGNLLDVTSVDEPTLTRLAVVDPAYELVQWGDSCPDELLDGLSKLRIAMNDAPKGDEPGDDWSWDAQRERDFERRHARWSTRSHVTAAVDRRSGELAGFTQLLLNERPSTALQEDTAVLAAHRGHGLGMSMKAANLLWLRTSAPQITRVLTWNAETNRHMRAVNERLGFQTVNRWHALVLKP